MATTGQDSSESMRAARARALAVAARRIADERAVAAKLRQEMLPRVREAVAAARAAGELDGRVWLIGSYAWGEPTPASDVDLLVEGCDDPLGVGGRLEDALGVHVDVIPLAAADAGLLPHLLGEGVPP